MEKPVKETGKLYVLNIYSQIFCSISKYISGTSNFFANLDEIKCAFRK